MPEELEGEFVLKNENPPKEEVEQKSEKKSVSDYGIEPGKKANLISNLCLYPSNVTFENQGKDEVIILLVRRDLITNAPWIFTALFLMLIPPFLAANPGLLSPFFNIGPLTQLLLTLFYYIGIFSFILVEFIIWFFNVGLVTNKRVVDLDVHGILSKHFSETKIELIEDVSYVQVGSVRTIFNYGDVHIQTAGTMMNFEFDRAPEPARVTKIIADMIGGRKHNGI